VTSLAVAFYGATAIWLNRSTADLAVQERFCRAWLCPDEFSSERVFELKQESAAAQSGRIAAELKRALALDSASAYRWADVGEMMASANELDAAKYCFQRALAAGPHSPVILFRAANFYFSINDYPQTLHNLSTILRNPELSEYNNAAFLTYTRMGIPVDEVLSKGIPPNFIPAQAFLRFLMESNQVADAETTWKWISQKSLYDSKTAGEYLGFLIRNKKDEDAAETWRAMNSRSEPDYRQRNWVFNGSFEAAPQPSPLDWTIESTSDVQTARTEGVAKDGRWSLKLVFAGNENVDFHQVFQQTVLKPGKWRARAFVKTDALTTDLGISLRVCDAVEPRFLDVATEPLTGTHDWTGVERTFQVGPQTALVRVEIARHPTFRFDNKIAGTAWVDSVELSPAP